MRVLKLLAAGLTAAAFAGATAEAQDLENTLYMDLDDGRVVIELLPDLAPQHVARIKELARAGFYDGIIFHRVIDGFMAQTGDVEYGDLEDGFDPRRVGTGSSRLGMIPAEFSDVPFTRGVVGMARSQHPDSASSQFFIMFADAPHLNGQYTVVGQVISGMEHVDAIRRGDPANNGQVANPDRMVKVTVASGE